MDGQQRPTITWHTTCTMPGHAPDPTPSHTAVQIAHGSIFAPALPGNNAISTSDHVPMHSHAQPSHATRSMHTHAQDTSDLMDTFLHAQAALRLSTTLTSHIQRALPSVTFRHLHIHARFLALADTFLHLHAQRFLASPSPCAIFVATLPRFPPVVSSIQNKFKTYTISKSITEHFVGFSQSLLLYLAYFNLV